MTSLMPVTVTLLSPAVGSTARQVTMSNPIWSEANVVDALIYRHYCPPAPADRSLA
jgi:hypothetical protein